jgi:hypothetical protein
MSGLVAGRLYALLPPRMPLEAKYKLTEALWQHVGPSSKKTLRVGIDTTVDAIVETAAKHIDDVVTSYKIPSDLERRFEWLSAGDVDIKQKLLNHLRSMEKELLVSALGQQLPVLLDHLKSSSGQLTHRLAQVAKVGKHELEILLDRNATGVRLEETMTRFTSQPARQTSQPAKRNRVAVFVVIGIVVLIWVISAITRH